MNSKATIMVVLGERQWTLGALHLACAVAHGKSRLTVLLNMVPVSHPLLLGTDTGYVNYSFEQQRAVREYAGIAACYGVRFKVCVFQYATFLPALVQAADQFDAEAIFATLPHGLIPVWRTLKLWWLRRALSQRDRHLYTLQPQGGKGMPVVTITPRTASSMPHRQSQWATPQEFDELEQPPYVYPSHVRFAAGQDVTTSTPFSDTRKHSRISPTDTIGGR